MPDVTASYEAPLILFCFYEFSHIINGHSCLKCCILAKLPHNVCIISYVTASYMLFGQFENIAICLKKIL